MFETRSNNDIDISVVYSLTLQIQRYKILEIKIRIDYVVPRTMITIVLELFLVTYFIICIFPAALIARISIYFRATINLF